MDIRPSKAAVEDAEAISALLAEHRDDPALFTRSVQDIKNNIDDFLVAKDESGRLLACMALYVYSPKEVELCSVAVKPSLKRKGIGLELIEYSIQLVKNQNYERIWLATMSPQYFSRFGFNEFSKWDLPWATLFHKLALVFQQPVERWLPAIFGRYTFMQLQRSN
ncbi:MAG: GNAT family N-acetyltransferase [Anaerolineales bacterium]|nr:GNAT family N-acetyltransferase [Anaerolineales bacterium]